MAYYYTPAYYSSFQDTIATLCATILPFSSRNRHLPADQKLAKLHSESLKWQQDSFHRILNLIGLRKEGIVPEAEVSAFRSRLLETLIAPPAEMELAAAIRDKLRFLQELLYSDCISAEEYRSSKLPLLQRLEAQGAEIDSRDVIAAGGVPPLLKNSEEEWTDINLNDRDPPKAVEKCKEKTPLKLLWRGRAKKEGSDAKEEERDNKRKKPFHALFQKEKRGEGSESKSSSKNQWRFEGLKKWKRGACEEESAKPYLPQGERSDDVPSSGPRAFAASPLDERPETKRVKKKELSRILSELPESNQSLNFCEGRIHKIPTKIPADSNKFFPELHSTSMAADNRKASSFGYIDAVEMENLGKISTKKEEIFGGNWVAFGDDEEGFHPNLFAEVPLPSNRRVTDPKGGNPFI